MSGGYDKWGNPVGGGGGATGFDRWGNPLGVAAPTTKPSGGGGGLLDFIGHEVSSHVPGGSELGSLAGGVGEVTRGFANDIGSTISAIGPMVQHAPSLFMHTLGPQGVTENIGSAHPTGIGWLDSILSIGRNPHGQDALKDPQNLIGQTIKSTGHDVHNVATGNWHALAQHPLSPLLDVMTVASLGGVGGLRAIEMADRAGMLAKGGRLSRLADENARVLKDANYETTLGRARTVQGRLAQNAIDRFSQAHPETRYLGAQSRIMRFEAKHSYYRTQAELSVARKMQRAGEPLTKDEEFASHIAAEGIPLRDRIALYGKLNAENPSGALSRYIRIMQRPGVAEALKNPRPEFEKFMHQVHGVEAKAGETLTKAGKLTDEGRALRAAGPVTFAREHGVEIGPSDISSKLPQGFRFPHVGTTGNPSYFRTPLGSLKGPQKPGFLRRSHLVRFARGQFITNPQAVYSEDFMRTARYLHELDIQQNLFDKVARPLDAAATDLYGRSKPENAYYWPASAQQIARAKGLTGGISRDAREAEMRNQDLSILDPAVHEAGVEAAAKGTVGSLKDLGLEGKSIERLQQLGVRQLPSRYANAYQREFGRANPMVRMLIDKPTSAWRSLTLKYRPAWAVNNILGQHLLYAMANPTPEGIASYIQAAAQHRQNRDTFEQIPGMEMGFAHTQKGITHTGGAQAIVDRSAAIKTARAIGVPFKAVATPIRKFGDFNMFLNQLGENIPREAQFIHLAKDKLDLVNQTLAEAVHNADPRVVQRLVDEVNSLQGDFGAMSHVERTFFRRALPFYSWFKVITKLTGKYAIQYPARVKMLQAMSNFLNEPNAQMPSYLQGFIRLFQKGQTATGLSTTGLNPFQTVPQLLTAAGQAVSGKPTFGTSNPGGLLNPGAQAGLTALTGQDQFTGNAYKGPGATKGDIGRFLGEFVSNLPEYTLAEKSLGLGPQSTLYSQQHFYGLPPYLWNYLGLPIRRVKLPEAASRKKAGQ